MCVHPVLSRESHANSTRLADKQIYSWRIQIFLICGLFAHHVRRQSERKLFRFTEPVQDHARGRFVEHGLRSKARFLRRLSNDVCSGVAHLVPQEVRVSSQKQINSAALWMTRSTSVEIRWQNVWLTVRGGFFFQQTFQLLHAVSTAQRQRLSFTVPCVKRPFPEACQIVTHSLCH